MKVALANSCSYLGGAEFWQRRFARFLQAAGDEVKFFLRPGKFFDLVKSQGHKPVEIAMRHDLDLFSILQFYRGLKIFQPEVVIFNDQRDLRLGAIAAGLADVPLKLQRKGWSYLKGSFRDRFYYKRVDYVACLSESITRLFVEKLKMPKSRLYNLPNGVELERFQNLDPGALRRTVGAGDGEVLLGMAGRLARQKRQGDLVRAVKILQGRGFKVRALLAGEGKERPGLTALVKELDMTATVQFLGFVDKIEEFLAGLDIFVFCSEWEGMPNAVLEAMACGKPVVAANIPGVKELVENEKNGILYPPGDVQVLAARLEMLITDQAFAAELSRAGRRTIEEKFDERKIFLAFREWLMQRLKEKG